MINFPPEFIAHRLRLNPSTSRQIEERVREASLKEFYQIISELADPNISVDDELFYLMVKAAVFRGDYTRCFEAAGNKQHAGILSWKAAALARTGQVDKAQRAMSKAEEEAQRFGDEFVLLENLGLKTEVLFRSGKTQESIDLFEKILQKYENLAKRSKNLQNALFVAQIAGMNALGTLGKYDQIKNLSNDLLPLLDKIGERYWKSQILFLLGQINVVQGNLDEGFRLLSDALSLGKQLEDAHGMAHSLRMIAEYWMRKRDYSKAIQNFEEARQSLDEIGDRQTLSDTLISFANTKFYMGLYEEALEIYQESLQLKVELGDESRKGEPLMGIANCEGSLGHYTQALQAFQEALRNKEQIRDRKGQALLHANIGELYFRMGDYELAEPSYFRGLSMFNELNHKVGQTFVLMALGKIALIRGQNYQAEEFLHQSLQLSEELGGHVYQIDIYAALMQASLSKKDISNAQNMLSKILESSQTSESTGDRLRGKYAEGFFQLTTGNLEKGEEDFKEALSNARIIKDFDIVLKALLGLSQVVIEKYTSGEEIKDHLLPYLEEMSKIASEKRIYPVLYRCWITQAILTASSFQFDKALNLLSQAQKEAKERGLNPLLAQIRQLEEIIRSEKQAMSIFGKLEAYTESPEGKKFQSLAKKQVQDYIKEASMLISLFS
ncbi:MAG: tetratricopeptide repeat protein [Candidatus Hermodarchaeota archaeon]